jgi:hypothetical protein
MKDFLQALKKNIDASHTDESLRRSKICGGCDEKSKRFYATFVKSEIKEVSGYACNRCDCPIATKVFATEQKNICDKWLK